MKAYERVLRALFSKVVKFEVSALQTRMMALEGKMKKLEAENERLKKMLTDHTAIHDRNIAIVSARAKAAFLRIGHSW